MMNRIIGMQSDWVSGETVPVWSSGKPPAARTPREKGDRAAEACAQKAEARANWDREGAKLFVLAELAKRDATGEDLTDAAIAAGFVVHDARAYGSVLGALSRAKLIRSIGIVERRKGNGTAGARLWRLA